MLDRFITFEGGEGAGKSTQLALLGKALTRSGQVVRMSREPGGSPLAERLRAFLLSTARPSLEAADEALLFAAARSDHLSKTVLPALAKGDVVLCDRFADSTFAYQGQAAGEDLLRELHAESVGDRGPSLTVILDIDPEVGLARARHRRGMGEADRFEAEDLAFHLALRARFLDVAAREPNRCVVIHADRDPISVHREVKALVFRHLNLPVMDDLPDVATSTSPISS